MSDTFDKRLIGFVSPSFYSSVGCNFKLVKLRESNFRFESRVHGTTSGDKKPITSVTLSKFLTSIAI